MKILLIGLKKPALALLLVAISIAPTFGQTLLLFDGDAGLDFLGCLNCSRFTSEAVCNEYGLYGSPYSSTSIWNQYSSIGSPFSSRGVWNKYASNGGLHIVDEAGNYYGMLTANRFSAKVSQLPLVQAMMELYDKVDDIDVVRKLMCQ